MSAITNCASVSAVETIYGLNGDVVTVSGAVTATASTAASMTFDMSIPIGSFTGTGPESFQPDGVKDGLREP
jgi:hypothetical protein